MSAPGLIDVQRCDCATVEHQAEHEGLAPVDFEWLCAACASDQHTTCDGWCP